MVERNGKRVRPNSEADMVREYGEARVGRGPDPSLCVSSSPMFCAHYDLRTAVDGWYVITSKVGM
jgi:hypothetical protein